MEPSVHFWNFRDHTLRSDMQDDPGRKNKLPDPLMRLFDCERETGQSNTQRRMPVEWAARILCRFSRLNWALFGWQGARKETREADSPFRRLFL